MPLIPFTITGYSPNPQSSQSWGGGGGSGSGGGGGGGGGRGNYGGSNDSEYKLSYSEIDKDLLDHPIYLLSCYGPGKDAPVQLFGGEPREVSPEEVRLRFYELRDQGQQQQAMSLEDQLWRDAEYQLQNAKRDINGAINFVKQGANQHPNRIDICNGAANVSSSTSTTGGAFGQPSNPTHSTLGHPLNPSDVVFGQPSNPSNSAFGQPSAPSQSAFGQPSAPAFGQPSKPAFGQPSQPASAFGQPSQPGAAFGQPSQPSNPFNQPAQQSNAFGSQPTQPAFGQPSKPANPFTQATTQTSSSPFGQPSQPAQPAFGQASQSGSSPFGQQSQNTMSPFGQANKPAASGAFGQPSQSNGSPANPFAPVNGTSSNSQAPQQQQQASNTFGSSGETVKDANGRLRLFNGRQVTYKKDEKDGQVKPYQRLPNGRLQMIWFPDGKTFQKPAEEPPGEYTPEIEAAYKKAMQVGHFEDGAIPLLPPKREWLSFNM